MSFLFGSSSAPSVPAPVPPPTIDQAAMNAEQGDRLRQRKGRASTILSPDQADSGATVSRKSLLGS